MKKEKQLLQEAVEVIVSLLEQCYPTERDTEESFEVDVKAECAGEDAINLLEKLGRAKWIKKPRIAIVFRRTT